MKVFKMNDFDWVCAENEQQAKDFYERDTEIDRQDIEDDFVGEENLNKTMFVGVELLTEEEKTQAREWKQFPDGQLLTPMSYAQVIKRQNITKPCLISTTEF